MIHLIAVFTLLPQSGTKAAASLRSACSVAVSGLMALVPCIIPFQPSWFPLQITQRCRWDAWSLCVIVVPQQAYETFHLLPRAPADSLGPAWPSDKHSPEVQVNLPGSPPLMGECQLPVLCLDNSGGPSQFEPLSLPVAPSVMGPHIVLFSSPISFSPLLAPAFWDHPPNQLPSQILLAGVGAVLRTAGIHCFSL